MTVTETTADRTARGGDRRRAIIDAAIQIIGELGYRGFSINALARRCGLTTAGLLHHFGSKEGLLVALLQEREDRDRLAITGRLELRKGQVLTRAQVLEVLRAIVEQNASQPQLVRLNAMLRAEALPLDHPASRYFVERDLRTRSALADVVRPHVADAQACARHLQAAMAGLEVQWLREDCGFDLLGEWNAIATRLLT